MSGPVDVLAVLYSAQWDCARERDEARANNDHVRAQAWEKQRAGINKSRLAIAQLTKAAQAVANDNYDPKKLRALDRALARLASATADKGNDGE